MFCQNHFCFSLTGFSQSQCQCAQLEHERIYVPLITVTLCTIRDNQSKCFTHRLFAHIFIVIFTFSEEKVEMNSSKVHQTGLLKLAFFPLWNIYEKCVPIRQVYFLRGGAQCYASSLKFVFHKYHFRCRGAAIFWPCFVHSNLHK